MDNETKSISFKGTAEGLVILIPKEMETGAVMTQVAEKVRAAEKFFRGAKLNVIYRGKKLTGDEEQELIRAMTENSSVTIEGIRYENPKPVERKNLRIFPDAHPKDLFKELEEAV